jgi:hypothetical protein
MDQGVEERQAGDIQRGFRCAARGGFSARLAEIRNLSGRRGVRGRWPSPTPSFAEVEAIGLRVVDAELQLITGAKIPTSSDGQGGRRELRTKHGRCNQRALKR